MSVSSNTPAEDMAAGNARWGTLVIVLVVVIIALVIGYVVNHNTTPAPQPVYTTVTGSPGTSGMAPASAQPGGTTGP